MLLTAAAPDAQAAAKIRAMLLTGEQGGPYHDWQATTPVLTRIIEETGLFDLEVVTAPPKGADFSGFKPEWSKYKVVILNYDVPDERWPAELKTSFEQYVRNGGGVVTIHAADNAFPGWREYNLMIGVGGWRGRTEKDGPYWYFKDGKLISDPTPGPGGYHGPRAPYKVVNRVTDHPITKGLPKEWMHGIDELYAKLRGPGEKMTVVSTAWDDPANKGTGLDQPILMVIQYGKGRVFHNTLGHDTTAMSCAGFITMLQRGAEWAATGKVTQKVPADFPTADKPSMRTGYAVSSAR